MAKQFSSIQEGDREFIFKQKLFFTGSAAPSGRVNVSPKGLDTFRILGSNEVAYLDLTGSGNETAAHVRSSPEQRLTLMFCSFDDSPLILRLYGQASTYYKGSEEYTSLLPLFAELPGARQIVHLKVDLVQTSCGYGVPLFEFKGERQTMVKWAEAKGEVGLQEYKLQKNVSSIDGFPTGYTGDDSSSSSFEP